MKRTKYDALLSDIVRIAALECEKCHRTFENFPDERDARFHCSHFYGRKYNSTRYLAAAPFPGVARNLFALCATCHAELECAPAEHSLWVQEAIGVDAYESLRLQWRRIYRRRKGDLDSLYAHYNQVYERLKEARHGGAQGYLKFEAFEEGTDNP